jgi:uncharacterized protein YxjI
MTLCIKERVCGVNDNYDVYDQRGNPVYHVKGQLFSLGHKIHITDNNNYEVIYIKEKVLAFFKKFEIYINGEYKGMLKEKFSIMHPKYDVDYNGMKIVGDVFGWDYDVKKDDKLVATIRRKTYVWSNTFDIEAFNKDDELSVLALAIAIDAVKGENTGFYYG